MPSPWFRAASTAGAGTAANLTINKPAGVLDGDILLAFLSKDDTAAVTAPAGWVLIDDDTANTYYSAVWYKRAATEGASWQWTFTSIWRSGCVLAYVGGAVSGTPLDPDPPPAMVPSGESTASTSSLTTTLPEATVLGFWSDKTTLAWSADANSPAMTGRVDFDECLVRDYALAIPAATGAKSGVNTHVGGAAMKALGIALAAPTVDVSPTLIGTGTAAFTETNGATMTPGLPTGWLAGDLHILLATRLDNTAMTSLAGWTQLYGQNNTAAHRVEVWWRRAVAGDTAPVVTFGSGTQGRGAVIIGVRGVAPTGNPVDVSSILGNGASATVTWTDVTTTGPNRLILALLAYEDDPTTLSTMTNFTQPPTPTFGSALGTDMMLGYEYRSLAAAGAASASTLTVSGGTFANSVNIGILLALLPDQIRLNMVEVRGRPDGLRGQQQLHQLLSQ